MREVEKYPSIVGFEPGTLALIANVLTNFAERTDYEKRKMADAEKNFELKRNK